MTGLLLWWHTDGAMAFLRIRPRGKRRYYYIVENKRRGGQVRQKILEFLGHEPDLVRLKRALRYWGVKAKPPRRGRDK